MEMLKLRGNVILFLALFLAVSFVSAQSVESDSYNVGRIMIGTPGFNAGGDYTAFFAATATQPMTRGGLSDSFTVNLGFFDNTTYVNTISIQSFAISPSSGLVGASISLFISALNAESVWARIVHPGGTETIVNLLNNDYVSFSSSIAGQHSVIFYANNTEGSIATASSSFTLSEEQTSPPPSGSSPSVSLGSPPPQPQDEPEPITEDCSWSCSSWSVCTDGMMTRTCEVSGVCEELPSEEIVCEDGLFDIKLNLKGISLEEGRLKFDLELDEIISSGEFDFYIKYSVILDGEEVFSLVEHGSMSDSLSLQGILNDYYFEDGEYTLMIEAVYGNLQNVSVQQPFVVKDREIVVVDEMISESSFYLYNIISMQDFIFIAISIIVILVAGFLYHVASEKKHRDGSKFEFLFIFFTIASIAIVSYLLGWALFFIRVIEKSTIMIHGLVSGQIVLDWIIIASPLVVFVVLLLLRRRIRRVWWKVKAVFKKHHPTRSIKDLDDMRVFTSTGNYLGKINEIIILKGRIYSLKVKSRRRRKKSKDLEILWKDVNSCGDVVIVDAKSLK